MSSSGGQQEQIKPEQDVFVRKDTQAASTGGDDVQDGGFFDGSHVTAIRKDELGKVLTIATPGSDAQQIENLKSEESEAVGAADSHDTARESEIQQEASQHMAHRAATMDSSGDLYEGAAGAGGQSDAPALPTRIVPQKESKATPMEPDAEYDEKHPPKEEAGPEVPEAPAGTAEHTGAEIHTIMDQFQTGMSGMGEQEIMSPRLERQQTGLILPPRSSSLEQKSTYTISPQTTGQSVSSQRSIDRMSGPPVGPGGSFSNAPTDDNESVRSARAGSIFQPPPPSPEPEMSLPFDFHRFLEQLRHRTADPVARFLRSFLGEFSKKQWMVHEQVKIISDFLEFISKKMTQCEVWRNVSDAEFDNAKEGMEKLVMNRLYTYTFSPAIAPAVGSPRKGGGRGARSQADAANPFGPGRRGQHQEDVEQDDVIAQKIRIYGWISEEHLDIKPLGEKGRKFLGLAQKELLKINSYRAPRDKVICVLNCCKVIFGFLKSAKADQSADAFVPLLIYTVLRAQPEHLVSNVQYIWRFRNQNKLGGEAGYYMSSLMGVVTFIENVDRTNLTISDEEFERRVEQAVSAITEENKVQENEEKSPGAVPVRALQHLTEKSALSGPEVTPRNSMDAERSSPRRKPAQRLNEKAQQTSSDDDDVDAVTGLLRTIQKPLNSIGRIFSDDGSSQQQSGLKLASTPQLGSIPRGLSPEPSLQRRPSADGRGGQTQRPAGEKQRKQPRNTEDSAARQASAEAAEAQRVRVREHKVVVETLQSMFPALDREVIEDVTRAQEGNVGRAVDACLALSG
ncbi:hypothetical protein LTR91_014532 [Friedmanniomyces endolithicus]|uniref:VPS9 domain-containing protein n=1 Tax=Friedmanniomyces endolithicus TaxID=329885 RepID=A0AAN6KBE1_9PEZI|nr:hypothetical protein LTS00_013684 [Friedmanniomyces endolithicus]KAK0303585.1 hypothetical protein LTR01_007918 [Friedmanniomyces endolithicus]KAK0823644.1 hypothetical protein LTR73_008337 [Friedmanniomyces endolithicus]KAK0911020.1 hypothetical protein LTR57_015555 [Friedmanniomyces endolithicus]KAK0970107.1 hypothetical protein LTS01_015925 [Friedmanniomyces endolithicus]